jgi:predicted extracellular nuclease
MRRGTRRVMPAMVGFFIVAAGMPLGSPAPAAAASTSLIINEIDYDQPGGDTAEFLELRNVGSSPLDLSEFTVELVNGTGGGASVYQTIGLTGTLAAGGYYVICANAANTANCDLDHDTNTDLIQNGAPDAAAVRRGTTLVDTVSYEGNTGAPYTEGSGVGLVDNAANANEGISRCPDGTDTDQNNVDFVLRPGTAGMANNCPGSDAAPAVDSTTPANGASNVALDANIAIDFTESVTVTGSWFTISCTSSGEHTAAVTGGPTSFTLDPDADFASGESCTTTVLAAQVSDVDTDDPPDHMAADHVFSFTTEGFVAPPIIINELDSDTPGTDVLEFVELYDGGAGNTPLDGLVVVFYNGSNDLSYAAFDLDTHATDADGYFLMGNSGVNPTPQVIFGSNGLQNGQDAAALYSASASDFPNGTAVTTANLVDAIVYDTSDADDPGLLVLLNPDEPQVNEDSRDAGANHSSQRCPDGSGGARNTSTYAQFTPTPGGFNSCVDDDAPSVTATAPASGTASVANDSNIDVTFSEPVNVGGSWFTISCSVSGSHSATVTGGPATFTLDPDTDFVDNETCTVTILAAGVSDQDTNDPPNNMAADHVFAFSTPGEVCEQEYTHDIYDIQGSGDSAAVTGNVTTQGVVVGDFEGSSGIGGFYLQAATGDGDPATSDGIFVFTGTADTASAGQMVRVVGHARERFNETALNGANSDDSPVIAVFDCGTTGSVAHVDVEMPFASDTYLEQFEGMLVRFPQPLVISEYFNYERFGEMVLALPLPGETRAFSPTLIDEPGAPAQARLLANQLRRITLDDGLGIQNPDNVRHPNGGTFALNNRFRGGDTVANTVGVLGFAFSLYRIQPTGPADYTAVNSRPAEPEDVGGRLKVAAMNTLNFFITLDDGINDICGGNQDLECRGADDAEEFTRQRDKLLPALAGLNSDVIGLNEIENTPGVDPLGDPDKGIVPGLNAMLGAGTYAHIESGTIGTDAIRVGLIYRPAAVVPVGDFEILDSTDDPRFIDTRSRPVLTQTFEELATGERFTVAVNHLKSKGSACAGDPDTGDGQGNCNQTRVAAAQALVDWLATDPTGSGDPDFLIMGDLNSYAQEDPIDAVQAGPDDTLGTADDYTNLIAQYQGAHAYSFVFDGMAGYLDHALSNQSLTAQVTGATEWHINADEPDLLDYDTSFKPPAQDAIYEPNEYRSSDHDPVVVGLQLASGVGKVTGEGSFAGGAFDISAQFQKKATTPSGTTTLSLDGGLNFSSTSYDWLVVSGNRATYSGSGTLNGTGGYGFLVSVLDGGQPGVGKDRIRVVIWELGGDNVFDQSGNLTSGNLTVRR